MVTVYAFSANDPRPTMVRIQAALTDLDPAIETNLVSLCKDEKGKPYLKDSPYHISISHSGVWWILAISLEPVGVDVQEYRSARFSALAKRFFHPTEVKALEKHNFEDFYKVWTAKESYVKLVGTGIDGSFGKFSIFDLPHHFYQLPFEAGYTLTVCTLQPGTPILKHF